MAPVLFRGAAVRISLRTGSQRRPCLQARHELTFVTFYNTTLGLLRTLFDSPSLTGRLFWQFGTSFSGCGELAIVEKLMYGLSPGTEKSGR